jgi:hypothetical protein
MKRGDASIRDIVNRMRHDGCGGRAGKAELLTGIEGVSSRPRRRGSCCARGNPVGVHTRRSSLAFPVHRSRGKNS